MIALGIDTTTLVCSVALVTPEQVLAEYTLNIKKTHSQRLMPLIDSLFTGTGVAPKELQAVAVACGPGSFTGIRIGVATARALAQGWGIPAVGVGTLEALADAVCGENSLACPLLDARRDQVYTALYRRKGAWGEPLLEPCALSIDELIAFLQDGEEPVYFLGDGVASYGSQLQSGLGERFYPLAPPLAINRSSLVARHGLHRLEQEGPAPLTALKPLYVREPQAVRRLKEKGAGTKEAKDSGS